MGGLPDNAGILRAVAELTSVGFEGGALRLDQILVLHKESLPIPVFDIFDQFMAN